MNKKWEIVAKDYNSPFWRNYIWCEALIMQPKIINISQSLIGIKGVPEQIDYFCIADTWEKAHKMLAKEVDKDITVLENVLGQTIKDGTAMNEFTSRFLKDDLTKYSIKKIVEYYKQHAEYNRNEYALGILLPILDFQDYNYIEDKLVSILESKLDKKEVIKAFSVFTKPVDDSFAIEQEKSILEIYKDLPNKNLLTEDTSIILEKLENYFPKIYNRLKEHTLKYAWVFYVYAGPAFFESDFIETMKFYFSKGISPEERLNSLIKEKKELVEARDKHFKLLDLSREEKRYVEVASLIIYLKPRRKDLQSKSYYHLEFLQKEIGRRLNMTLDQVRGATINELSEALNGREINIDLINERIKLHIIVPDSNEVKIYSGQEALNWQRENIEERIEKVEDLNELSGQSACPGKVTGIVRIINRPQEMIKMSDGDILVSTATMPSIVPAIRRASAIITDEGGLTCHAAIVSREFQIPCVIGTKIATRILKDGDLVEVDATHGIVKKV